MPGTHATGRRRIPISRDPSHCLGRVCGYRIIGDGATVESTARQGSLRACLLRHDVRYRTMSRRLTAIRNVNANPSCRKTARHRASAQLVRDAISADLDALRPWVAAQRKRRRNPRLFM